MLNKELTPTQMFGEYTASLGKWGGLIR
jgi:hypothetical protein